MASRARPEKLFRAGSTGMCIGKPSKRSSAAAAAAAVAPVKDSQEVIVDADLTRALKQIFEVRNCKLNGTKSPTSTSEESSVTLFGRKLSSPPPTITTTTTSSSQEGVASRNAYSRQGTDKLPPAATAHLLKELHKQRLKQKGITPSGNDFPDMGEIEYVHTERRPEVSTLPLLNTLQEKRPQALAPVSLMNLSSGASEAHVRMVSQEDVPEPKRQRIEKEEGLDLSLSTVFGPPNEEVATTDEDVKVAEMRSEPAVKNPEQLTLFYNGQVLVYEDVSVDKAKAIMVLAKSISSKTSCFTPPAISTPAPPAPQSEAMAKAGTLTSPRSDHSLFQSLRKDKEKRGSSADVPQARKASIQRFLEKRKDRYTNKEVSQEGFSKKEESRPGSPSPGSPSTKQFSGLLHCDSEKLAAATEMQTESNQWIGV